MPLAPPRTGVAGRNSKFKIKNSKLTRAQPPSAPSRSRERGGELLPLIDDGGSTAIHQDLGGTSVIVVVRASSTCRRRRPRKRRPHRPAVPVAAPCRERGSRRSRRSDRRCRTVGDPGDRRALRPLAARGGLDLRGPGEMERPVEGGSDQGVHPGVTDHEGLLAAFLDVLHAGRRRPELARSTGPARERPAGRSGFEPRAERSRFGEGLDLRRFAIRVAHRPAAAEIEDRDLVARRFERVDQITSTPTADS